MCWAMPTLKNGHSFYNFYRLFKLDLPISFYDREPC